MTVYPTVLDIPKQAAYPKSMQMTCLYNPLHALVLGITLTLKSVKLPVQHNLTCLSLEYADQSCRRANRSFSKHSDRKAIYKTSSENISSSSKLLLAKLIHPAGKVDK